MILAPALSDLALRHPNITVELTIEPANIRIERWEADLAVRLALPQGGDPDVIVRRLGAMAYASYGAANESAADRWIAYGREFAHLPESRWLEAQPNGLDPVLRSNDPEVMAAAAAAGVGKALLPTALGESRAGIKRVGPIVLRRDVWLLQHRDIGRTAHVRAVARWIGALCRHALA